MNLSTKQRQVKNFPHYLKTADDIVNPHPFLLNYYYPVDLPFVPQAVLGKAKRVKFFDGKDNEPAEPDKRFDSFVALTHLEPRMSITDAINSCYVSMLVHCTFICRTMLVHLYNDPYILISLIKILL